MKKMMIAAVLFALSAGSALAANFGDETSTSNGTETQVSATQAGPGAAVQVGKFFGGLLKAPLAVGRDVFTGFKAGISGDSQEPEEEVAADTTQVEDSRAASVSGPQGLQATLKDRLASAKKSFAETCKNCNTGSERQMSVSSGSGSSRSAGSSSYGGSESYSMSAHTADVQHLAKDDVSPGLSLSSLLAKAGITSK